VGKWRVKGGWPCVQTGPVMTSVCRYILWLRYLSLWLLCCTTCVCVFVTVLRHFQDYMLSIVCVCDSPATVWGLHAVYCVCLWQSCNSLRTTCCLLCVCVTVLRQFEDYMLSIVCVCVTVLRHFQDYMKPEDGASDQARSAASAATSADSDGAAAAASSLGDNTLTVNLGIPIVVVVTKVCYVIVSCECKFTAKWSPYMMSSFQFLLLESIQSLFPGMYVAYKKGSYPDFRQSLTVTVDVLLSHDKQTDVVMAAVRRYVSK